MLLIRGEILTTSPIDLYDSFSLGCTEESLWRTERKAYIARESIFPLTLLINTHNACHGTGTEPGIIHIGGRSKGFDIYKLSVAYLFKFFDRI